VNFGGEIDSEITINGISYRIRWKDGVEAYDKKTGEYYYVYYPSSYYSPINVLDYWGPYVLIGTDNKGLIVIHTETFYLKRYKVKGKSTWTKEEIKEERMFWGKDWEPKMEYDLSIDKIDVLESAILVNDKVKIDFPNF